MTNKQMILQYIMDNGSITPVDAMREFGCMRLAARIADIKADGYKIIRTIETGTNRYGKKVKYARYAIVNGGNAE